MVLIFFNGSLMILNAFFAQFHYHRENYKTAMFSSFAIGIGIMATITSILDCIK